MGSPRPVGAEKLLVPVIKATAANGIKVKVAPGRQVHNRIDGGGENMDVAARVTAGSLTWRR